MMRRRELLAGATGLGVLGTSGALAPGAIGLDFARVEPVELETPDTSGSTAGTAVVPNHGRVTSVELFATRCPVCKSMMPLEEITEWWADNGEIWPVALDAELELTEQFDAVGVARRGVRRTKSHNPATPRPDERGRIVRTYPKPAHIACRQSCTGS